MKIMKNALANFKAKHAWVRALVKWQNTMWYPVLFAALGVVSALFGIYAYVPVFYVYTVTVVFAALFNDDWKVFLTPLFLIFFAVGKDGNLNFDQAHDDTMSFFAPAGFIQMMVCTCVMIAAFVAKLIVTGAWRDIFVKRGAFSFGLLCLSATCLANGAFSPSWTPMDLVYGLLEAGGFLGIYAIFAPVVMRSEDVAAYACKVMMILGFMVAAEVGILSIMLGVQGQLFGADGVFLRDNITFGWGVSTIVACVLALAVPASMAVAYGRKHGTLAYVAAVLFVAVLVFLQARNALLFGAIALLVGGVVCCISGKNKIANRYFSVVLVGGVLVVIAFVLQRAGGFEAFFEKLQAKDFFHISSGMNQRDVRWMNGLEDFARSPVFGVGYVDGSIPPLPEYAGWQSPSVLWNMYHNIFIQLIGSMGIVGLLGFLVHFKKFVELLVTDFSWEKLLLFMLPITLMLMSVFDIYYFLIDMQIFYGTFLAVIEKRNAELCAEKAAKPSRVPFGEKAAAVFLRTGSETVSSALAAAVADRAELTVVDLDPELWRESGNAFVRFLRRVRMFVLGASLDAKLTARGKKGKEVRAALAEMKPNAVFASNGVALQVACDARKKHPAVVAAAVEAGAYDTRLNQAVSDCLFLGGSDAKRAERMYGFACGSVAYVGSAEEAAERLVARLEEIPRGEKSELADEAPTGAAE